MSFFIFFSTLLCTYFFLLAVVLCFAVFLSSAGGHGPQKKRRCQDASQEGSNRRILAFCVSIRLFELCFFLFCTALSTLTVLNPSQLALTKWALTTSESGVSSKTAENVKWS